MKGKQKRSELSDNEPDKDTATTPTTISKPDTHKDGTKSMNISDINQRPEQEASTRPLHRVCETLQERSPTTITSSISNPTLKSNSTVPKGDSVPGIIKASAKKDDYRTREKRPVSRLGNTKSEDKDSTFKDTNKDSIHYVPDMKKVGNQTDEIPSKMDKDGRKMDSVEVSQYAEHKDTVIKRAKRGYTTTTDDGEYEGNAEQSYEQQRRYSQGNYSRYRQETGRELTQQDPLPKGRTGTTLEKRKNDENIKGITSGIRFEQWTIGACVVLCAIVVYISRPNQEIKELQKRLDKMQKTDDSVYLDAIQNMKRDLQNFKSGVDDLQKNLNDKIAQDKEIQDELVMLKKQRESQAQEMAETTRIIGELKSKMEKQSGKVEDLGKDIAQVKAEQDKAVDALKLRQDTMSEDLEKSKHAMKDMQSDLSTYQIDIKDKSFQIQKKMAQADKDLKVFEEQMRQTSGKLLKHDKELDTAFDNLFNKKVAMVVIILMLSVNIGLVIAVYILCQNQTRLRSLVHGRRGQNGSVDLTDGAVGTSFSPLLEEIPMRPRLRPALGVISFSREYQQLHKNLVQSVMENWKENLSVEYCTILENRDIPNIPCCRLVVIFVEHTDRHVILEEEGDALGDCNRSTLMAVQKIGAIPVIVYDKDLGSRRLAKDQLYNTQIWGVRYQTELIKLSRSDRFFSVYEKFSEIQGQAFRKLIENHLQSNLPENFPTVNDPFLETASAPPIKF